MKWGELANEVLEGKELAREQALQILLSDDKEIMQLIDGAFLLRNHFFGKKVKLNMIMNAKSGLCPEDCGYCSQSSKANTEIEQYPLISKEEIVEGAKQAKQNKIGTYCIVMSGRRPTNNEVESVISAVEEIKESVDQLKICTCLGLVTDEQARRLKEAGVDRFNHNINTSKEYHSHVTTTHGYDDRVKTLETLKEAGISPCSGVICGMGETNEDIVDMAFSLKELDVDSIPVNFLHPIPGTKFADKNELTPIKCLKILALFRYVNPTKEIRISGGRELQLRTLQPLGLYIANSIFVGDYLTTDGQETNKDYQMIYDLGFEIEENPYEAQNEDFEAICTKN